MERRHDRRVRNPQPLRASHLQLRIQHRHIIPILAHLTSPRRVIASRSLLPDIRLPGLPISVRMMRQIARPATFYDVLRASTLHDDLVPEPATLGENEHV